MKIEVVYQHSDFIIINKPEGISVHKDQEEQGLTELVAKQLNVPQVWLVHRLDKETRFDYRGYEESPRWRLETLPNKRQSRNYAF